METSSVSRSRRGSAASLTPPKPGKLSQGAAAESRSRTDRLTLSRQVVNYLDTLEQQRLEQQRLAQKNKRQDSRASSEEALLERAGETLKAMLKCQKIAARISAGDNVPAQDLKYLIKNDPSGYKLAMATRVPKKNPKDYDTVLDEKDVKELDQPAEQTLDGMSAPAASAPGMSGGGSGV